MTTITLAHIRTALMLDPFDVLTAHQAMAPMPRPLRRAAERDAMPNLAAVLILLYPVPDDDLLAFAMIKRNEYPGVHSGQIGFPGGRHEVGETYLATALRETHEELGVPPDSVDMVGQLSPIYIPPSDFEVHPFVGYMPKRPQWVPDPNEVAGVLEMTVPHLLDITAKRTEPWTLNGYTLDVPFYAFAEHKIWGATAIILSEFEHRLQAVLGA